MFVFFDLLVFFVCQKYILISRLDLKSLSNIRHEVYSDLDIKSYVGVGLSCTVLDKCVLCYAAQAAEAVIGCELVSRRWGFIA